VERFAQEGIATQALRTAHAFHSALMAPAAAQFLRSAVQVQYRQPEIDFISNVAGELASTEVTRPDYWCRQIREPVQFSAGVTALAERGYRVFLEIGPQPILAAQARACVNDEHDFTFAASLRRGRGEREQMLGSAGALYRRGVPLDWRKLHGKQRSSERSVHSLTSSAQTPQALCKDYARHVVSLPTYPFQRRRFWIQNSTANNKKSLRAQDDRREAVREAVIPARAAEAVGLYEVHWEPRSPADG
jgi:acyl transferase domain-containing protein